MHGNLHGLRRLAVSRSVAASLSTFIASPATNLGICVRFFSEQLFSEEPPVPWLDIPSVYQGLL